MLQYFRINHPTILILIDDANVYSFIFNNSTRLLHGTCLNYFLFSLMFVKLQIFIYFFNIINSTFNDRDTKLYCYYYASSIQTTRHQNEKKSF